MVCDLLPQCRAFITIDTHIRQSAYKTADIQTVIADRHPSGTPCHGSLTRIIELRSLRVIDLIKIVFALQTEFIGNR